MKYLSSILFFAIFNFILCSCSSTTDKKEIIEKPGTSYPPPSYSRSYTDDDDEDDDSRADEVSSICNLEDGTYSAEVDYYNPDTGFSNTYTLDVDVESCQVVQINFPNGGWLDEDHIDAADIDEGGNASVSGENGKTYDVHIDN